MPAQGRVGVIGLGSMGLGMALSLKRAGFDVAGCDVTPAAVAKLVAEKSRSAATPAEAAHPPHRGAMMRQNGYCIWRYVA